MSQYVSNIHRYSTRYKVKQISYTSRTSESKQSTSCMAIDIWKDLLPFLIDSNVSTDSKSVQIKCYHLTRVVQYSDKLMLY